MFGCRCLRLLPFQRRKLIPTLLFCLLIASILFLNTHLPMAALFDLPKVHSGHSRTLNASYHPPPPSPPPPKTHMKDSVQIPFTHSLHQTVSTLSRSFPRGLVIGAAKAGTRAVLEFLNMHPDIVRPRREIHFFDKAQNYKKGYRWYLHQMPESLPHQVTIEKTAMYYAVPEVPQRVHRMNSSIKLLLVVRNPISRTISDYLHMRLTYNSRGLRYESFENMAIDSRTGNLDLDFYAIQRSQYHHHLWRWLELFPLSQIHIIDGDKLKKEPWVVMKKIERFLGISKFYNKSLFTIDSSRGFFCMKKSTILCLPKSKGRKHPTVDSVVIHKLRDFFKKENEKFFNLTGQKFSW